MFIIIMVIVLVIIKKGFKYVGLYFLSLEVWMWFVVVFVIVMVGGYFYIQKKFVNCDEDYGFVGVESIFSILMVIIVCVMVFVYGLNDVVNVIGFLFVVVLIVEYMGEVVVKSFIVWWIFFLGGFGIVVGFVILGYKVMVIIGIGIIELMLSCGFVVQLVIVLIVVLVLGIGLLILIM